MARYCYTAIYYLALPLILLRLLYRGFKAPRYWQRIGERFGFIPLPGRRPCLWVHAVSVGETIAAVPVIRYLLEHHPQYQIVVTTMTPTGSEQVKTIFGDDVYHVYAPYDEPTSIRRFLNSVQPRLLVIMETELWPNLIHYSHKKEIPVMLANARLSARSARGYDRVGGLARPMLNQLAQVAAQHQADADRFQSLGMPPNRLQVTGSIKLDITIDKQIVAASESLKSEYSQEGQRFVWIAASTHEGEDEKLLAAHQQLRAKHKSALLILVPRHPERFNRVAQQSSVLFNTVRRSQHEAVDLTTEVVVGDTMGELLLLYGCADVAFVGGSLVAHGGHNMLEPAAWGLPIVTGKHNFNFEKIAEALAEVGGLQTVSDTNELAKELVALASQPAQRKAMGQAASSYIDANRGALNQLLNVIDGLIQQ